jgi:DNA-binding ferritin-like protein
MKYLDKMAQTAKSKVTVAGLVVEMMDASNKFHILHLTITGPGSFSAHKALGDLYDALPEHADTIAEGYQGVTGEILDYPDVSAPKLKSVKDAINYIEELHNKISKLQDTISYTEIVNDLDAIKSTLNSAKYKLKFLS